jgi:hypothetical protein
MTQHPGPASFDAATGATTPPAVGDQLPDGTTRVVTPPIVYLPCALDEDGQVAEIKMVRLRDGRVALMAYSALDRLARACGEAHPWVLYDTARLEELRAIKPYDAAYLDVGLPSELKLTGDDA